MFKSLLRILLLVALGVLSGCSLFQKKKPSSSAHLYEGDGPSIHFSDRPEAAGGEIHPY